MMPRNRDVDRQIIAQLDAMSLDELYVQYIGGGVLDVSHNSAQTRFRLTGLASGGIADGREWQCFADFDRDDCSRKLWETINLA
jgi:hypothetical protein